MVESARATLRSRLATGALIEMSILVGLAAAVTSLFWLTHLDLTVASLFYGKDDPAGPWPYERFRLWDLIYRFVPPAAALTGVIALAVLAVATLRAGMVRQRLNAATLLLTLLLGPALLVNLVFKDNWGRPRPRQTVEFGGDMHYAPPLQPRFGQEGRSFTCGHCSVGFSLLAFWFIFKRRHRRLAWLSLLAASLAGLLVGAARMAAGGHYLSDVLWSGFVVFFAAWFSYYVILRVPRRSELERIEWPKSAGNRRLLVSAYVALALGLAGFAWVRSPVSATVEFRPISAEWPVQPRRLELRAEWMNLSVRFVDGSWEDLYIHGSIDGDGMPLTSLKPLARDPRPDDATLRIALDTRGFFTQLDGRLSVEIPNRFESVLIAVDRGRIEIEPHPPEVALPRLRLVVGDE